MKRLLIAFMLIATVAVGMTVAPKKAEAQATITCGWQYTGTSTTWWGNTYYDINLVCCPMLYGQVAGECWVQRSSTTTTPPSIAP